MTYKITATAPTSYQYNSLSQFGMIIKKNCNGSFSSEQVFNSEEEAKEYLTKRADKYNDEDPCGSQERLADMYADIEHGSLTLDAVTAHFEEIEEYEIEE